MANVQMVGGQKGACAGFFVYLTVICDQRTFFHCLPVDSFSLSCRKIGTHYEKVNEKQESGMKTENENIPGRKRSMQASSVSKSNIVFPLQLAYA